MMKRSTRHATPALAVIAAIVAAGCVSGASPGKASSQTPASSIPNPFSITARFDASSLKLDRPIALAIGPDGNMYVTDNSPAVTVISPDGKALRRWGSAGARPGEFSFGDPSDAHGSIAVGSDGRVYVSDSGNHRIQVFSATGAFIRQFGSQGAGEGQFLSPFDLAVDRDGNVYVADDQEGSVSKFSPTGAFAWRIGGYSSPDQDLLGHEHLASIDPHGSVVMVNDDNSQILYIDAMGRKVDAFGVSGAFKQQGACNVTVDAAGYAFVNSCSPGRTLTFDRTHELIGGWYGNDNPLRMSPVFGPNGEIFALGRDGAIIRLKIALPKP